MSVNSVFLDRESWNTQILWNKKPNYNPLAFFFNNFFFFFKQELEFRGPGWIFWMLGGDDRGNAQFCESLFTRWQEQTGNVALRWLLFLVALRTWWCLVSLTGGAGTGWPSRPASALSALAKPGGFPLCLLIWHLTLSRDARENTDLWWPPWVSALSSSSTHLLCLAMRLPSYWEQERGWWQETWWSPGWGQPPLGKPVPWGSFILMCILMCLKALNWQLKVVWSGSSVVLQPGLVLAPCHRARSAWWLPRRGCWVRKTCPSDWNKLIFCFHNLFLTQYLWLHLSIFFSG